MTKRTIPAISIIIPMYNAEKYIGECLDSILAQTFEDYEVIVVDDCSTDNSASIVKSYVAKFTKDGIDRLRYMKLRKNSGAPGIPNNTGLKISRGEYISFIESDDAITNTAYEELYPIAKHFDADVVHCESYYRSTSSGKMDKSSSRLLSYQKNELVKVPTLISEDFIERVKDLHDVKFQWNVWTKLIRRKFIIDNKLQMINANAHDFIYTCCLVPTAKRYVRVPNVINFYRVVADSMSHKKESVQKTLRKHLKTLTIGFAYVDEYLSARRFYQQHPDAKYLVLDVVVREFANYLLRMYSQVPAYQLDEIVRAELKNFGCPISLASFIFGRMNLFNVNLLQQQSQIQQLQNKIKQLESSQSQVEDVFK